jgi:hypothetical protein
MKKMQVFFIFLVGMILAGAYVSNTHAAPSYELTVKNQTTITLEFAVVGPENHLISIPSAQKMVLELNPGVYQYSFYNCGQLYIDTVDMNKDREIKLLPCSGSDSGAAAGSAGEGTAAPQLMEIVLNNKTYKQLTVALLGIENYSFEVLPGKNFFSIYQGTYQMSYYDCGKLNISTVKFTKNNSQIKILDCGQGQGNLPTSTGGTGTGTTSGALAGVPFVVKNFTFSSFDMLFQSDTIYTFSITPGKNKINILPGYYRYSYYACGELWVGNVLIANKDSAIEISSCSSHSGRPNTGQNIEFKVKNLTGTKFTITFDGPQFYTLEVKDGTSTLFEVEKGYYTFQYYACGAFVTGEVNLKEGVTIKTINCKGD